MLLKRCRGFWHNFTYLKVHEEGKNMEEVVLDNISVAGALTSLVNVILALLRRA